MEIRTNKKVIDTTKEGISIVMTKLEKEMLIRLLNENEVEDHQLLEIRITNII